MKRFTIDLCGDRVQKSLLTHSFARVMGSISKGIFLLFPNRKIAFISYQPYAGPLNLTLCHPTPAAPLPIQVGEEAQVSPQEISFPAANIRFDLGSSRLWKPPSPPPVRQARAALDVLAQRALAARSEDGWAPLLPHLLGWPDLPAPAQNLNSPWNLLRAGQSALQAGEFPDALQHFSGLLGLGHGLTPSGDDCLTGLLLVRFRAGLLDQQGCDPLAAPLVAMAYQRTTAISANIIEAAAVGAAEQRLLAACDAILAGNGADPLALSGLLEYGSSSGLDVLVGMAMALTSSRLYSFLSPVS